MFTLEFYMISGCNFFTESSEKQRYLLKEDKMRKIISLLTIIALMCSMSFITVSATENVEGNLRSGTNTFGFRVLIHLIHFIYQRI